MTVQEYKVYENRLRRAADRQVQRLVKSRARDARDITYGTYMLVDQCTNGAVFADWALQRGFGLDLHDVADYLFADTTVHADHNHDDGENV